VRTIIVDSALKWQYAWNVFGLLGKQLEKSYNGGMGSNGLSSARHDVLKNI
jgi:hypothetical protein